MKIFKISKAAALVVAASVGLSAGGKMVAPVQDTSPVMPIVKQEGGYYAGVGLAAARSESYFYGPDTTIGLTLRGGYDYSKYIGVELRAMKGVKDINDLGMDYSYGLYLKPQYPITPKSTLYGLLGYSKTKISYDNEPLINGIRRNKTTQSGFSFGGGFEYHLNKKWSLFVDAMRNINESTTRPEGPYRIHVNSITIGMVYHF